MPTQTRDAAIVGAFEYPLRKVEELSPLQIKAECAIRALEDAGLTWKDVDAIYEAGEGGGVLSGIASTPEYFGVTANVCDTTMTGGSSYEFQAAHAKRAIAAGKANVALLTYGSTNRRDQLAIGAGGRSYLAGPAHPVANLEELQGLTLVGDYAMVAARHAHEYGTTLEQRAAISVATRSHAVRNPQAVQAMTDMAFQGIGEITVEDVVNSRMIADPLHLLECCMISDGGGAVVIASADVARGCKQTPVWVLGGGEAVQYPQNNGDITTSAASRSGPPAFAEAGVRPDEIDICMLYDSFTITVLTVLEDLGFCKKGEGGEFVQGGRLRFDTADKPALNTDGGGLSSNHPGMRGIFLLIEATRQLRGQSTSQVQDARLAVASGLGGRLGGRHAAGTVVLGKD
ncbi:MAG: thiolase domain-containing protein [Dehalococcoidia bacterium]